MSDLILSDLLGSAGRAVEAANVLLEKAKDAVAKKVMVDGRIDSAKLEIEQTASYGGSRATYLKYELTNVQVRSFDINGSASDESPPSVTIANNFEEYKVTYTEYDSEGNKGGNAETTWKVEKGEK